MRNPNSIANGPRFARDDHDEDSLEREGGEPTGLRISIGVHRFATGEGRNSSQLGKGDGSDIPRMSRAELAARIHACECELRCLKALRDGDHEAARKHNQALQRADKQLDKFMNKQSEQDDDGR